MIYKGRILQQVNKSVLMPYSREQVYALVNDIHSYPEFLPWCAAAQIKELNETYLTAEIIIVKGPIRVTFMTKNELLPPEKIKMHLHSGPFRELEGFWQFDALSEKACRVTLQIQFEFENKLLCMSVSSVFQQILSSLVDAFLDRARVLYARQ